MTVRNEVKIAKDLVKELLTTAENQCYVRFMEQARYKRGNYIMSNVYCPIHINKNATFK